MKRVGGLWDTLTSWTNLHEVKAGMNNGQNVHKAQITSLPLAPTWVPRSGQLWSNGVW